jgi:hypothetical protein
MESVEIAIEMITGSSNNAVYAPRAIALAFSGHCSLWAPTSYMSRTLYAITYLEIQMKYPNGARVR